MRDAYSVAKVRTAEGALMAQLPEGTLMQRAAAGLAAVCAGLLAETAGGVYGSRVVILTGTGDNGGDALYAGERLARRGAAVIAIQAGPGLHAQGSQALRAAGGRIIGVAAAQELGAGRFDVGHEVRRAIGRADLIVDGLLGIGGKGGLREPFATLAQLAANSRNALTLAVDLPSGIDADTGTVDGPAVRADVTVTFGALKPGLLIDPGQSYAGVVEIVDIGLAPYLDAVPDASAPQGPDIAAVLPRPTRESDKYRRGVIGLLVGSDRYTGAALLATGGAVHGGAGMVRLVTGPNAAAAVRLVHPEVIITVISRGDDTVIPRGDDPPYPPMRWPADPTKIESIGSAGQREKPDYAPSGQREKPDHGPSGESPGFPENVGRVQAWVAGPGMGTDDLAAQRLGAVLATGLPVLVDADGLTILSQHRNLLPRAAPTLLTPHAGELGRLLGVDPADVEARRLEYARAAATKFGACVLLKGSTTVVAPPDGLDPVLVNTTGTPYLATAGSGDVLSGLAGALLAQGLLPPQAAITAAYLHGLAARLAVAGGGGAGRDGADGRAGDEAPIGASDLISALPRAFRTL